MRRYAASIAIAALFAGGCADHSPSQTAQSQVAPAAAPSPAAFPSTTASPETIIEYDDDSGDDLDQMDSDREFSTQPIDPATGTPPETFDPNAPVGGDIVGSTNGPPAH